MDDLCRVFNHVVLPPHLPGNQDPDLPLLEKALLGRMQDACTVLIDGEASGCQNSWMALLETLKVCGDLNSEHLDRFGIQHVLKAVPDTVDRLFVCYISEQNAALLIHRHENVVVFEAFEASPQPQDVLQAANALRWTFPSQASQLPVENFNEGFHSALAGFLEKASTEVLTQFCAKANKGGNIFEEVRIPRSPALITHMLLTVIEALGEHACVSTIEKRVRDDVVLNSGTAPWRRLPFWLILRVATQRQLQIILGQIDGTAAYKLLMCVLLAKLLDDCLGFDMDVNMIVLLKKKLCRRLGKLHAANLKTSPLSNILIITFARLDSSIESAEKYILSKFDSFKRESLRHIPFLTAHLGENDPSLLLSLPSSKGYLSSLCAPTQGNHAVQSRQATKLVPSLNLHVNTGIKKMQLFGKKYSVVYKDMRDSEIAVADFWKHPPSSTADSRIEFDRMARCLSTLIKHSPLLDKARPEHNSIYLLDIFDVWAAMDAAAVVVHPILKDYCLGFSPDLLNVLQLPKVKDMARLRHIQSYIYKRNQTCRFPSRTIFSPMDGSCLASRFAQSSPELQTYLENVREREVANREQKTREWISKSDQYERMSKQISASTCMCSIRGNGVRNSSGCTHCFLINKRKRMRIKVMEDFLPINEELAAAMIFEMSPDHLLAEYRHLTWEIIATLAYPSRPLLEGKAFLLSEHRYISSLLRRGPTSRVVLASPVKAVGQTHYKKQKMPVQIEKLLCPLAARFDLYDSVSKVWIQSFNEPLTLAHWCGVRTPVSLRTVMPIAVHPPTQPSGPSSYATIANRFMCPPNTSTHEFEACQNLLLGTQTRWLTMLVELGSSNLNFGREDIMLMYTHLALQVGPMRPDMPSMDATSHESIVGVYHAVFAECNFVRRLMNEISNRLNSICRNWHETNTMELLITLVLRAYGMATDTKQREEALRLVGSARSVTLEWIRTMKDTVSSAEDGDVAQQASMYAFKAALLCRRTMSVFIDEDILAVDSHALSCYIQASIALQQNLVVDVNTLSMTDEAMLHRDFTMAGPLKKHIRDAIERFPKSINAAIAFSIGLSNTLKPDDDVEDFTFTPWIFHNGTYSDWVTSIVSGDTSHSDQRIDFHYTEGHILVDGKTVGKLPQEIRDSGDVKELLGSKHLLTLPSALPGMSHRLMAMQQSCHIHFGLRDGRVIIKAQDVRYNLLHEYVPRRVFISGDGIYDLPRDLVDNCTHWFNVGKRHIEFRRGKSTWRTRLQDWRLNLRSRKAWRKRVQLVDPFSRVSQTIVDIFRHFEDLQRLTIVQPLTGALTVELRHLDLTFYVNRFGLLESSELCAEIDPDQDAGTLYGYRSMIVLRDTHNSHRRSLIAPLGPLRWSPCGPNIHTFTDLDITKGSSQNPTGQSKKKNFVRFTIDSTLGRLACPPEMFLLYTKALLHAFTSCPLADTLTGRTGEEEAVETLLSGRCQPWEQLGSGALGVLKQLQSLAPYRQYYPVDMRVIQTVKWNKSLPRLLQHDRYGRLVWELLLKSHRVGLFQENAIETENQDERDFADDFQKTFFLNARGEIQRLRYETPTESKAISIHEMNTDLQYFSLGCMTAPPAVKGIHFDKYNIRGVFQTAKIIQQRSQTIITGKPLHVILNDWKYIGGHQSALPVNMTPLGALMDTSTIGERWGELVELCRTAPVEKETEIIFLLAVIAFSPAANMDCVRLLAAYFNISRLREVIPPSYGCYSDFCFLEGPASSKFQDLISLAYEQFSFEGQHSIDWRENNAAYMAQLNEHKLACQSDGMKLSSFLLMQWPSYDPTARGFTSMHVNVSKALDNVLPEWQRLLQNKDLSEYVMKVESILKETPMDPEYDQNGENPRFSPHKHTTGQKIPIKSRTVPSLASDLLQRDISDLPGYVHEVVFNPGSEAVSEGFQINAECMPSLLPYTPRRECTELHSIVSSFSKSTVPLRQKYGRDLDESLKALEIIHKTQLEKDNSTITQIPDISVISEKIRLAEVQSQRLFEYLYDHLSTGTSSVAFFQKADVWPRLTPVTLLELLRSSGQHEYGKNVRTALLAYGCSITTLQRLRRVSRAIEKSDAQKAAGEWQNFGHENWNPANHADWLLFEIDSDILIRKEQVDVARAIISPESRTNSVLQLNMGKGKTSCIVPMAIASLANGRQLARLVVPKALLLPTAQMIQSRLGGLVGRELRHIAFSRSLASGNKAGSVLQVFKKHHQDLLRLRGVLLAAPEHILAFSLCGWQCLADKRVDLARDMIQFQSLMTETMCRDIFDESDFTLGVRTQLVYPSGTLRTVDGAPHRWKLVQTLLSLVEEALPGLCHDFPQGIQAVPRPGGGYPMIYILQSQAEEELKQRIKANIVNGRVPFFRPSHVNNQPNLNYANESRLIGMALQQDSNDAAVHAAAKLFVNQNDVANGLFLVRGLLAHGILSVCLKKRWNVEYGLHPHRWPIAVPYKAKGVPSERAEFGHPDVAILFTCLAFYYAGLDESQFGHGLKYILQHADDPATEYESWTAGTRCLPDDLRHWNMINVDDHGQTKRLWEHLRLTRPVINHYLNTFVFPVHARQFSVKLQASAWDLPLFTQKHSVHGRPDGARTTGFSGTNDNKMMLPLTIKQQDLPSLQQTNAEVLTYLLEPRNRHYICTGKGTRWSEFDLLKSLFANKIRVLIDAGAYILERDNESLARQWLDIDWEAKAAVYFGEQDNRAWVLFRDPTVPKTPLVATPFFEQLDGCVVYFDEAHTRGVDLLLPSHTRGALTLALGQTKDHTVQAAMRLRQLATTQSVQFYAPPEVDESIRNLCCRIEMPLSKTGPDGNIDSPHIIAWLLEQTCLANESLHPLYLSHGQDFCSRTRARWDYSGTLHVQASQDALCQVLEMPERQSLIQLYGKRQVHGNVPQDSSSQYPSSVMNTMPRKGPAYPDLELFMAELQAQKHIDMAASGKEYTTGAFQEVEQEREMEVQVEQEHIVGRRTEFSPLQFPGSVHKMIRNFVITGNLNIKDSGDPKAGGFEDVFSNISRTGIGIQFGVRLHGSSRLFVSNEFHRTVNVQQARKQGRFDNFIRPVQWVLWSRQSETAMVIIPEELELLLPSIRRSKHVHLLAYAAPVTRSMMAFSSLEYYTVPALPLDYRFPSWLPIELGILAGRLYMTFEESVAMADYLGAMTKKQPSQWKFCPDPVGFLLEWLPLRRVGQDIMYTPAAYICQGRQLHEDHTFFLNGSDKRNAEDQKAATFSEDSGSRSSGELDYNSGSSSVDDDEDGVYGRENRDGEDGLDEIVAQVDAIELGV